MSGRKTLGAVLGGDWVQLELGMKRAPKRSNTDAAIPSFPEVWTALEESVRLQAHYASLLNQYDAGHRILFTDAAHWINRLRETGTLPKRKTEKEQR